MISKESYDILKEKYGNVSSWAVWEKTSDFPKSNMRDVSMFEHDDILEILNPDYVFIGLNGSGVHDDYMDNDKAWHNFHSSNPSGNDFKLRYALMDTPFWGAYITDAIKELQEVDSNKVDAYLKKHPEVVEQNMKILRNEIEILGTHPTIIALGSKSYELVSKHLGSQFTVKKIMHYSYTIGKEDYREQVLQVLLGKNGVEEVPQKPLIQEKVVVDKDSVKPINPIIQKKIESDDDIPSLEEQLRKTGLDIPNNWRGDNRNLLMMLFDPLIDGSDYRLCINESDTTKKGLNLFYKDSVRRCMGFEKIKDMKFKIYPIKEFYEELQYKVDLPEPDPKKSQPHMKLTLEEMWELMYIITR